MKRLLILSTLSLGLFFVACKKDKSKTNADLLKDGKWQMVAGVLYGVQNGQEFHEDAYADLDECEKDDFITFDDNKIYIDQGADLCDPNDSQVETANYTLSEDGEYIIFEDGFMGGSDSSRILELSESTLKIKTSVIWEQDEMHSEITLTNLNK